MRTINPDERQAIEGYIGDMAKRSKDFYQDTLTSDEMHGVYERAELTTHVMLHIILPHKIAIGMLLLAIPGDEIVVEEEPPDIGQWDHYFSYSAYAGRTETLVYIESQAPNMEPTKIIKNSDGSVTISLLAIDPTHYPERASYKIDLIDHTIFEGPTAFSDLIYHYRINEKDGSYNSSWVDLLQNSVCVNGKCTETEVILDSLPNGNYEIEVYATDEVGNDSKIAKTSFSITGASLEPQAEGSTETNINYKTYSNHGLSFDYPSDWMIVEDNSEDGYSEIAIASVENIGENLSDLAFVFVFGGPTSEILEEFELSKSVKKDDPVSILGYLIDQEDIEDEFGQVIFESDIERFTIDGNKAAKVELNSLVESQDYRFELVLIIGKNTSAILWIGGSENNWDSNKEIFEHLLNTLQLP